MRKVIEKILGLFRKKKDVEEQSNSKVIQFDEVRIKVQSNPKCSHCHSLLDGYSSATDKQGNYYTCCKKCNYVNKLNNGRVIPYEDTKEEINNALYLFQQAGTSIMSYKINEDDEEKSVRNLK